jgi:hypothetical protein
VTDTTAPLGVGAVTDDVMPLHAEPPPGLPPVFELPPADETVVQRAGTIFHEARHAQGWCDHTDSCLDGSDSCDPNWANGCVGVGSGSGKGANAYTVPYMNWFATSARAGWINTTIRANAVSEGNKYLSRRFGTDPCFA